MDMACTGLVIVDNACSMASAMGAGSAVGIMKFIVLRATLLWLGTTLVGLLLSVF